MGSYAAPGETAPNFGGSIGVNEDQIAGTDVTVPIYNFSETHFINNSLVNPQYKLNLFLLTGKVNGAVFVIWNPVDGQWEPLQMECP